MINIVANLIGFSITFPLATTIIVYILSRKQLKNNKKALHTAVNYTTLFYILSVITVLYHLTSYLYAAHILILLITLLGISVTLQWKTKGEIVFSNALKVFWRFNFLLFLSLHICVVFVGLVISILHA